MQEIFKPILKQEPYIHADYYNTATNTGYLISNKGTLKKIDRRYVLRDDKGKQIYPYQKTLYHLYKSLGYGGYVYKEHLIKGSLLTKPAPPYRHYCLSDSDGNRKFYYGHILVLATFNPPDDTNQPYEVNHKDLNKDNNYLSNLEWVNHKQNMEHASNNNVWENVDFKSRPNTFTNPECRVKANRANQIRCAIKYFNSIENIYRIRRIYDRGNLTKQSAYLISLKFGTSPRKIYQIAKREKYNLIPEEGGGIICK